MTPLEIKAIETALTLLKSRSSSPEYLFVLEATKDNPGQSEILKRFSEVQSVEEKKIADAKGWLETLLKTNN